MSSTVAALAPSSTSQASPACAAQLYNIPVQDASCAIPYDSSANATDIMSSCCNSAAVVSYYDNCGLYCLAEGQSVEDLTSCLMQSGAQPQDVFCRGNVTATATGSSDNVPPSAQATVVSGGSGMSGGNSGSGSSSSDGSSGSSDDGLDGVDSGDDSSGNGAGSVQGGLGFGKLAVAVCGLLAVPFWIA